MCGGTCWIPDFIVDMDGLSPRVRGNLKRRQHLSETGGSIPACAGEPISKPSRASAKSVYPRVCGGTDASDRDGVGYAGLSPRVRGNRLRSQFGYHRCYGLSPRVRGNRVPVFDVADKSRSIPACAGEPVYSHSPTCPVRVYPRVCGGTPVFLDAV